jgi:hypothetical protein
MIRHGRWTIDPALVRIRVAIDDQQHVALPKLYGVPAYGRPPAVPAKPVERPFDPDQLPIEAVQTDRERELARQLAAGVPVMVSRAANVPAAAAPAAAAPSGPGSPPNGGSTPLNGRSFRLRAISNRLRDDGRGAKA